MEKLGYIRGTPELMRQTAERDSGWLGIDLSVANNEVSRVDRAIFDEGKRYPTTFVSKGNPISGLLKTQRERTTRCRIFDPSRESSQRKPRK